jgi:hypothetical protein
MLIGDFDLKVELFVLMGELSDFIVIFCFDSDLIPIFVNVADLELESVELVGL